MTTIARLNLILERLMRRMLMPLRAFKDSLKKPRQLALERAPWMVAIVLVSTIVYILSISIASAAIPKYINFQGKLTDSDGNPAADGTYTVTFRLYDVETGGTALWTEEQSVTVTSSIFNAVLGTETALGLTFDRQYWISVQVSGDSEMTPRQRLTASGYALNADSVDTLSSAQFLRSDADDVATGQITLNYPGTALLVQPSTAPTSGTNVLDVKDVDGTTVAGIDDDGDLIGGNLYLEGHSDSIIYFGPKSAPIASITIDKDTGEMTFSDDTTFTSTVVHQQVVTYEENITVVGDATFSGTVSLPAGSVDTAQLAADAVTSAKIEDGVVASADIADATIVGGDLAADITITTSDVVTAGTLTASSGNVVASAGDLQGQDLILTGGSDPVIYFGAKGDDATATMTIDATTGAMEYTDEITATQLNATGASPSALNFGTGANRISLIYDPESDEIRFSRGTFAIDLRNKVKNGSFESFSALEEFHDYDTNYSDYTTGYSDLGGMVNTGKGYQGGWDNFAPDEWTYESGDVFQHAPLFFKEEFTENSITGTNYEQDFTEGASAVRLAKADGANGEISQVITGLKPSALYSVGVKMRVGEFGDNTGGTAIVDIDDEDKTTSTNINKAGGITAEETDVIVVNSVAGFPAYGVIKIGDERITYGGLDTTDNEFLRLSRGVDATGSSAAQGAAAVHANNAPVSVASFPVAQNMTLTSNEPTDYAKYEAQFCTNASADDVTIRLKATNGVAYFDTVQVVAGGTVPEFAPNTVVDTGDQTIYGSLRIGRASDDKGGILSVDKFIRARGIELFTDAPGLSGALGGGGATVGGGGIFPPGDGWNESTYQRSPVQLFVGGDYASTAPANRSYKVKVTADPEVFEWYYMDDTTGWSYDYTLGGTLDPIPTSDPGPGVVNLNDGVKIWASSDTLGNAEDTWYFSASNMDMHGGYDSYAQAVDYVAGETRIYKDQDPGSPYYNKLVFQNGATKVSLEELAGGVATGSSIDGPFPSSWNSGGLMIKISGSYNATDMDRVYKIKISTDAYWDSTSPPYSDRFQWKIEGTPTWYSAGSSPQPGAETEIVAGTEYLIDSGIRVSFEENWDHGDNYVTAGGYDDFWSFTARPGSDAALNVETVNNQFGNVIIQSTDGSVEITSPFAGTINLAAAAGDVVDAKTVKSAANDTGAAFLSGEITTGVGIGTTVVGADNTDKKIKFALDIGAGQGQLDYSDITSGDVITTGTLSLDGNITTITADELNLLDGLSSPILTSYTETDPNAILKNGLVALTADWNMGAFDITGGVDSSWSGTVTADRLGLGGNTNPTVALDVTGDITLSGTLSDGTATLNSGNITTTGLATVGASASLGLEVKGTTELNEDVRIGSSDVPTVALDVTGETAITGSAGAAGSAAADALVVTGGTGGVASGLNGEGGIGADIIITAGDGGDQDELDSDGGKGGGFIFTTGIGGDGDSGAGGRNGSGGDIELTTAAPGTGGGASSGQGTYGNILMVKDGGLVGVGTTAPTARLQIGDPISPATVDHVETGKDLYVAGNLEVDGNVWLGDATTDTLTVTGTLDAANMQFGGNFLPSADSSYDLGASGNEWANAYIDTLTLTTALSGASLDHGLDDAYDDGQTVTVDASGDVVFNLANTQDFHVYDNSAAALTVTDGGLIGIGTTGPLNDLTDGNYDYPLVGGLHVKSSQSNGARLVIEGTSGTTALDLIDTNAAANEEWMQLRTDGGITKFWSVANSAGAQVDNILVMDHSNGNVGIGTNSPGENLSVKGDVVISPTAAWAQSAIGADADLAVEGRVGIGTTTPSEALDLASGNLTTTGTGTFSELDITQSATHAVQNIRSFSTTDLDSPWLTFRKSASNTIGTFAETADDERLGVIEFKGVDSGGNSDVGAWIYPRQQGVAGVRVPTDLKFMTASDSTLHWDMFVLRSDGNASFDNSLRVGGNAAPTVALDVTGEQLITAQSTSNVALTVTGATGASEQDAPDVLVVTGGQGGIVGKGGAIKLSGGTGGTVEDGGSIILTTGTGGVSSAVNPSGDGGNIELTTGAAGEDVGGGSGSYGNIYIAKNGGKVGIGTTDASAPGALLDIGGGNVTDIDGTDDLLVKDDIEVDGDAYVAGTVTATIFSGSGAALTNISGSVDLDGEKLILDADADTSITADTDDQIDIEIGGDDIVTIKNVQGDQFNVVDNLHTQIMSKTTGSTKAAYFEANANDVVRLRMQAAPTTSTSFIGAMTNHPFNILTNGTSIAQFEAGGDVRIFNSMKVGTDADPSVTLDVTGEAKIAGSAGAAGSDAPDVLTITGGNAVTSTAATGDAGSDLSWTSGNGGNTNNAGNEVGGRGGNFTWTAGDGGTCTNSVPLTKTGGKGGGFTMTTGAGADSGTGAAGSMTGADGGDIELTTGAGGTGSTDNGSYGNIIMVKDGGNVGIGTTLPAVGLAIGQGTAGSVSTDNDLYVTGGLEVDGASYLGGDLEVAADILPSGTRAVGSSGSRWNYGYFDNIDVTTLNAGGTQISGTESADFTINSDNASADGEAMSLAFERGTTTPNASIAWDNTNDEFDFNADLNLGANNLTTTGDITATDGTFSGTVTADKLGLGGNTNPTVALDVTGDIKLSGRVRQGSLGDLAEMIEVSSRILNPENIALDAPQVLARGVNDTKSIILKTGEECAQYLMQKPEAADVVIIDEEGGIRRSSSAFDRSVAGIISTNPAQILRDDLENAAPLALSGVVPCKVTAENGTIKPGDLLVSSSVPGHAMCAGDNPPTGSIIGKALSKLAASDEVGVVNVLVMMQ